MKLLSVRTRSQLKMGTVLTSKKLNGMRLYQTVLSPIRKCRVEAHRRIQTAGYHNYLTVSVPGVCSGYFSQCSLSWGGQGDFLLPLAFLIRSFTLEGKWQLISDVIGPVCWENVSPNSPLVQAMKWAEVSLSPQLNRALILYLLSPQNVFLIEKKNWNVRIKFAVLRNLLCFFDWKGILSCPAQQAYFYIWSDFIWLVKKLLFEDNPLWCFLLYILKFNLILLLAVLFRILIKKATFIKMKRY